ncbi:MAG: zinc ribbon domain-containing protein [Chloroflexi bacterium]|nr:MAG: zinc ribbon domain-containing protein [Chloroflexota bacterium]TMF29014.1 MAG: zinc ribbon domain-containing protein [Chloroflexota bacterium]TMF48892.1 MAG: zinc ribbon domain-containing protein [Chloroflexota bacterium]TMG27612.1 MAG: zinc ribbon domain-containing protein [Chloroflexota bacterium]
MGINGDLSTCGRARSAAARTRSIGITPIIVFVPIYEYRCEECGKRSSALLGSYSSADPACPHCGKHALRRLVSTFATVSSGEGDGGDLGDDFGGGEGDFGGGDDDFGGGDDDF